MIEMLDKIKDRYGACPAIAIALAILAIMIALNVFVVVLPIVALYGCAENNWHFLGFVASMVLTYEIRDFFKTWICEEDD